MCYSASLAVIPARRILFKVQDKIQLLQAPWECVQSPASSDFSQTFYESLVKTNKNKQTLQSETKVSRWPSTSKARIWQLNKLDKNKNCEILASGAKQHLTPLEESGSRHKRVKSKDADLSPVVLGIVIHLRDVHQFYSTATERWTNSPWKSLQQSQHPSHVKV